MNPAIHTVLYVFFINQTFMFMTILKGLLCEML
jgi:hypothetical protein